jgi:hypothetical protein
VPSSRRHGPLPAGLRSAPATGAPPWPCAGRTTLALCR